MSTATRYHLSSSNKPAICQAEQRPCPRGHYDTLVDAQTAAIRKSLPEGTPEADLLARRSAVMGVNPNMLKDDEGHSLTDLWRENLSVVDADRGLETPEDVIHGLVDVDFGRERALGFEWRVPGVAIDIDDTVPGISGSDDFDQHIANGEVPVMWVHTRNGGGNRECYCYDVDEQGHELGCLEQINEAMQAHPLYLHDQDDTYDSTYANFYFSVPPAAYDRLKKSYADRVAANRVHRADSLKQNLVSDHSNPSALWMFFKPNEETFAKRGALQREADAFKEERKAFPVKIRIAAADAQGIIDFRKVNDAELMGKIEDMADRVLAGETFTRAQLAELGFSRAEGAINALQKEREVVAAAAAEAVERDALLAKMAALDPELAKAAAKHMNPSVDGVKTLKDAQGVVERTERQFKQLAYTLRTYRTAGERLTGLESRIRFLQEHVRFPGNPEQLKLAHPV